eukprot:scaffold6142_cov110-Isochrysis_galbana.AAC.4
MRVPAPRSSGKQKGTHQTAFHFAAVPACSLPWSSASLLASSALRADAYEVDSAGGSATGCRKLRPVGSACRAPFMYSMFRRCASSFSALCRARSSRSAGKPPTAHASAAKRSSSKMGRSSSTANCGMHSKRSNTATSSI